MTKNTKKNLILLGIRSLNVPQPGRSFIKKMKYMEKINTKLGIIGEVGLIK